MMDEVELTDQEPSEGFSTCITVSVLIKAPVEEVFKLVTDIRNNTFAFPDTEFRYDGEYPIKTGDIYYTRKIGKSAWSTYRSTAVEENQCMAGELVRNSGIFKRMRYDH